MKPLSSEIDDLIVRALEEDSPGEDLTTELVIPNDLQSKAVLVAKQDGILAGIDVAIDVFRCVDNGIISNKTLRDGDHLITGNVIMNLEGRASSILKAERIALNFLMGLSGVATETHRYVVEIQGYNAQLLDTRKTTPGLRSLQKYATNVGGAKNHRLHLSDGILIKDNHITALRNAGLSLREIVKLAVEKAPEMINVEVEVEDIDQVKEALAAGAGMLLLDNMEPERIIEIVELVGGTVRLEASGGINLKNVKSIAATGVDFISIGAITHSAPALDMSLNFLPG